MCGYHWREMLAQFDIILLLILPVIYLIFNHVMKNVAVEDETLHAKQARAYYNWDFMSWNPMITTPPSLYIISMLMCSSTLPMLRLVNLIFGMQIPLVVENNSMLVVLMPILFPFIFLYYTDCGSLIFVLLSEHLYQKEYFFYSSLTGLASLTFRQTNIVWIGRLAAMSCIEYLKSESTFYELYSAIKWYVPVLAAFLFFLKWNHGIVLGDRKSHQPCANIPQIFYCILTHFLLYLPSHLTSESKIKLLPAPALLSLTFLHFMALQYFSYEHPYHGPKSRHITSFLLRSLFTGVKRYAWIPVFIYAENIVVAKLYMAFGFLGTVLFLLCTAFTTIPSRLVEPRYYMISAAIFMKSLHISDRQYFITVFGYAIMDVALLALMIVPVLLGRKPIIW